MQFLNFYENVKVINQIMSTEICQRSGEYFPHKIYRQEFNLQQKSLYILPRDRGGEGRSHNKSEFSS